MKTLRLHPHRASVDGTTMSNTLRTGQCHSIPDKRTVAIVSTNAQATAMVSPVQRSSVPMPMA